MSYLFGDLELFGFFPSRLFSESIEVVDSAIGSCVLGPIALLLR